MIELHYWPTPNGHKMTMFFEETGIPYKIFPVNLQKEEQFKPEFLKISPNNKMPAIVDGDISIFESGAILLYLAEKSKKLIPSDIHARADVLQWLFWQVGGFGPMLGQNGFFRRQKEPNPPAIERYTNETKRLYGVLNKQLDGKDFVAANEYSIADIAIFPWAAPYENFGIDIKEFPHVEKWLNKIGSRASTKRAYEIAKETNPAAPVPPSVK